jgi:hypothetical protein
MAASLTKVSRGAASAVFLLFRLAGWTRADVRKWRKADFDTLQVV